MRKRQRETVESRLRRLERWLGVPGRNSAAWREIARDDGPGGKVVAESVYDRMGTCDAAPAISFLAEPDGEHLLTVVSTAVPRLGETVCLSTQRGRISGLVSEVFRFYSLISEYCAVSVWLAEMQVDLLEPHEMAYWERVKAQMQELDGDDRTERRADYQ
jgi:hypothetical protein